MGASIGTGDDKKSVNVELNIVPFIDLMSCLTAFLLVTAVWVSIESLNIKPKGKSRDPQQIKEENEEVKLSVLITSTKIWIGQSRINEFMPIERTGDPEAYWTTYTQTLTELKKSAFFVDRGDIEIAAESLDNAVVVYQDVIRAMEIAESVGFSDVGLTDKSGLSAPPQL
ncbi:MAG: biopolymer transporter ExbD [Kofleriaceae bacterium]|nr:biopolymer transporter ExbD [Myxococcales bacterium]MCB9563110.1 biopolymer transporter ExbD [Kofleriaceae bacterium]